MSYTTMPISMNKLEGSSAKTADHPTNGFTHTHISSDLSPAQSPSPAPSQQELEQIWEWNATVPEVVQGCVHDLITEIAESQPDALAVSAWDGDFSYIQLDALANEMARGIACLTIPPGSFIPILLTKSKWTPIAMLGIIKAGYAAIALDTTQPDARLRSIVEQTGPKIIVSSSALCGRARSLADMPVFQIDDELSGAAAHPSEHSTHLPDVSPSDIVYISFTSGTTGQPKGACISHANVRSAVFHQGAKLGFHRGCRTFDFAPYSFDVAWSNFLHTICAGGCLCIARDDDMLRNLSASITSFKATLINITPTVLRTLNPIPSTLQTVLLSGEMPYRENVTQWAGRVKLLNTYGPTECTFKCAFSVIDPSQEDRPDIGKGMGFSTWLVDPLGGDGLVPIGSVGELWLEGPLVGQGYLGDPQKTASAFISDPKWLLAGSNDFNGRPGRLYKTGDLVRYTTDGRLSFIGRQDTSQQKVRGQRVEIGDVEHHVQACLGNTVPAVVEVIVPQGGDSKSLALFVEVKGQDKNEVKRSIDGLADKMREVLPAFMIPSIYLPIDKMPVASTGKVDRRRLREMGSSRTWGELLALQSTIMSDNQYHQPHDGIERQLADIWATVLGLDGNHVSRTDSFLRLGGDSIAAIRVVAASREKDLVLSVADLFTAPVLHDLAEVTRSRDHSQDQETIPPFSLLSGARNHTSLCEEAGKLCDVEPPDIEDVYPCTPLQEGMLSMTARKDSKTTYVSRTAFELPEHTDVGKLQSAWEKTVQDAAITRTRIVDIPKEGLVQVVVKGPIPWHRTSNLEDFFAVSELMGLGTPLCRAGVVATNTTLSFVLEMHHAVFDGWSNALILDAVEMAYRQGHTQLQPFSPFQSFIKYLSSTTSDEATAFWRDQLINSEATVYPPPSSHPKQKLDTDHHVSGLQWPQSGITRSSVVRSALSLLLAAYTNSDDVKYGATVSGRSAAVPGVDRIAAPTIATVPVRVKFDWDQTVESLQHQIQRQAVAATQYEQLGLQRIQSIEDIKEASQFQLLLVVQPAQRGSSQKPGGLFSQAKTVVTATDITRENGTDDTYDPAKDEAPSTLKLVTKDGHVDSMGAYNSYDMMIIAQLEDTGITLKANYDTGAIEPKAVQRMLMQLEHLLRQLCDTGLAANKLSTIDALTKDDADHIWMWNRSLPEAVSEPVTAMVDSWAADAPNSTAISSWDQTLDYVQLQGLIISLVDRLRERGVGFGSIVVLSFEKSSWLVVCMLAALRIGAIALPLSSPTSAQRSREVFESIKPQFVITSTQQSPFDVLIPTLTISDLLQPSQQPQTNGFDLHQRTPGTTDPALILFTSGSTGTPKAILWSHAVLSSNVRAHAASFGVNSTSRVFQFAGYDFDVSTVEALSTLAHGGCLCIPSESDRTNRLAAAINEVNANWLFLTPSILENLAPEKIPTVQTIATGGEKVSERLVSKWVESVDNVYNWFGPAEASVAATYRYQKAHWKPGISGRSTAGLTWLVDPKDSHKLAPVGAVTELCMEGPIVASYTGVSGPDLNEATLFSPRWLLDGYGDVPGRHAHVYRTGDLVRYDSDGAIIFLGRKHDSQKKLRGQRVELGDIEVRAQSFLSGKLDVRVVAEIFAPALSDVEILALFISPGKIADIITATGENLTQDIVTRVKQLLPVDELEEDLLRYLPTYMIPKVYVPIPEMPMNNSAKTDRRRLRQIGSSLTYEELAEMQPSRRETRQPSTSMEKRLQKLWADTIGIRTDAISANDNFLRLGGDSITAMRLVASARNQGLALTVADVFEAPQLEKMANRMKYDASSPGQEIRPFSLLGPDISESEARSHASRLCSIPESRVVDVFPCTALQQGLLALGTRRLGRYVSRSILELQPDIDADKLRTAWLATVEKLPLLRTRIFDLPGRVFVQAVLDNNPLRSTNDVNAAALIGRVFVLTIHHCVYDGNVLKMILEEFQAQYLGEAGMTVTPFKNFIHHLSNINPEEAANFWRGQLSNAEPKQFPVLPSATYEPQADEYLLHNIEIEWPKTGVTAATIIRSAWALLATQYTSSSDVFFGLTVNGRQADMRGLENCAGPTISAVPIAITVDWDETLQGFLSRMQRHMTEITPYEQYGLQNIQRLRGDLDHDARLLQTLLVVQPVASGKSLDEDSMLFKARSFSSNLDTLGTDPFNNYALSVICELAPSELRVRMSFDGKIMDREQVGCMTKQFEAVLRQLCAEQTGNATLDSIQTASSDDLDLFWAQNAELPPEPELTVPELIAENARKEPDAVAIDGWDGQFTYREFDDLSTLLARGLISLGVKPRSVVALNFEKSKWVHLIQLAVLKAGAVETVQSLAVPDLRIKTVFENIGVVLAVVSETRRAIVSAYAPCYTVQELLNISDAASHGGDPVSLPTQSMEDPAVILVSSGSTGQPKQVLWSHRSLAANAEAHGDYLGVNPGTRLLQFASYDFDISTIESFSTFVHLGCVCVPSEEERLNATTDVINRFAVHFMNITPSTAKAIRPEDVPDVSILVLSGENVTKDAVDRWKTHKCQVLNWYGSVENTGTICDAGGDDWYTGVVARISLKQPVLCWLIDPRNHDRLVPFGAVGEIAHEGPLSAVGYVGNETLTVQKFRNNPIFLTSGHGSTTGRRNTICCSGDLGRYDNLGNLVYMGRKDAQLKIRGQLVAPEEVQRHVQEYVRKSLALPNGSEDIRVVVDAIKSQYNDTLHLVAFLGLASEEEVQTATTGLNEWLKRVLPVYAIPVYYIPVPEFPLNANRKLDRNRLREMGTSFDPSRQASSVKKRGPTTQAEKRLAQLWSRALGIDVDSITASDSFLRVGDSIQAMRLVGIARQEGLLLSVAQVFQHPTLEEMAKVLKNAKGSGEKDTIAPFSLLNPDQDVDTARGVSASLCGVSKEDIEDLFPCTPLQEGLLALSVKRQGDYIGRNILELDPYVDLDRFKKAWLQTVEAIPILRTRIVDLPGQGLVQAHIKTPECPWTEASGVDEYVTMDSNSLTGLGSPLMRCALFTDSKVALLSNGSTYGSAVPNGHAPEAAWYFALTLHHSIYDGLTTPLILETLHDFYNGTASQRHYNLQPFVKYIRSQDKENVVKFWKTWFTDLKAAQFPTLPSSTKLPQTDSTLMHRIEDVAWRTDDITPSTLIRATLAIIISHYSQSPDVILGEVSAGRKIPIDGIERLAGPTIATVPVRIKLEKNATAGKLLPELQRQAVELIQYEQTGLSAIRQISDEAAHACQFQTQLVVQSAEENVQLTEGGLFVSEASHQATEDGDDARYHGFQSYALSVICTPGDHQLGLRFLFDSSVIKSETVQRMAQDFEQVFKKLCSPDLDEAILGEISLTTDEDLNQIWKWNSQDFGTVDRCAATWIVEPENSERLAPIGAIGELCLEGPLVGQGCMRDPELAAKCFLQDPEWLLQGSPDGSVPGRSARLYKTGNLVRYNPANGNGTIIHLGKKARQAMIKGQKFDLAEVERQVRDCFLAVASNRVKRPGDIVVVAEVVTPRVTGRETIAVFIQLSWDSSGEKLELNLDDVVDGLESHVREHLPAYMIPGAYVPMQEIHVTANGKTGRKALRELGAELTLKQLADSQGRADTDNQPPLTDRELQLRELWVAILGVSSDQIQCDSNLLLLGGDSISAMRLAALARSRGISLTVQSILQTPRLRDMAEAMIKIDPSSKESASAGANTPFSLLKHTAAASKDVTLSYIAKHCGVEVSQIEDAFPCTSVQKSLLSMTARSDSQNSYVARFSIPLRADIDLDRLKNAWEYVGRDIAPILRYRIVDLPAEGLVQVQVNEKLEWDTYSDVDTYLNIDRGRPMGLGTRLTRLGLIGDASKGTVSCSVTQHHAIYDGYSVDMLLAEVFNAYSGLVNKFAIAPFQAFIKDMMDTSHEEATDFWRQQFAESEAVPFPTLPHDDYRPKANSTLERDVANFKFPKGDYTASTVIRAAWSILTACYTDNKDVVFGAMVTGRQVPIVGIDRMIAPLISAVPVRVKFDPKQSVAGLLRDIQQQAVDMMAYEQTELLDIRRISVEAERGSRFNTLLVVQPVGKVEYADKEGSPFQGQPVHLSSSDGLDDFNPNAVMIMLQPTDTSGLHFEISFDSTVVDQVQMERMAGQFEHILRQLSVVSVETAVEDVDTISEQAIRKLWEWNNTVPEAVKKCIHDLIGRTIQQQPREPAICAWDGDLSYADLGRLSGQLASHLAARSAGPGSIIPLCFEKSMWYPVAALGAMRAGAACVAMDSTQPEERLRSIVQQINPKFILASASNEALASRLADAEVVVVDRSHMEHYEGAVAGQEVSSEVSSSDTLYVVFTSGSTGVPKGIVTTHESFASAATHQRDILRIRPGTRVFDFVSYNFDVSWSNHLQTLICGGCLCIPSETQRKNDIAGALNRMQCDYTYFTPSVAKSLDPSTMTGLKILAMGGEAISSKEVVRWTQVETIIGIYGPAECAQALSFALLSAKTPNGHIGHSYGANTWLVQPGRPGHLAAIGTVGELMIEGPTVSNGYFGEQLAERTLASYIHSPKWLSKGTIGHPGRRGTLHMTGDLCRYNSDGSLDFVGRKDGMIKLRGQRIELTEVEHHVHACLNDTNLCAGLVAEIITPKNGRSPLLAVFLGLSTEKGMRLTPEETRLRLNLALAGMEEKLWDRVPQYMVPGAYIQVSEIPTTTTNKTDRRKLRELGNSMTLEQLAEIQPQGKERQPPSTQMEKRLQALWSSVLEINAASIGADSSFLRIGGESIAAMRLVVAAREQGIALTVANIFKTQRLSDLALVAREMVGKEDLKSLTPFSLLNKGSPQDFLNNFVLPVLDPHVGTVRDVIPTTDFQDICIQQALQDPPDRWPCMIYDLPAHVDFPRLDVACRKMADYYDVFKTVFVQAEGRFWQVLLSDHKLAYDYLDAADEDLAAFTDAICEEDIRRPRKLGHSFIRFVAVRHNSGQHKLVIRISHAHFDGFSWGSVLDTISSFYMGNTLDMTPSFSHYIAFQNSVKDQILLYWAARLKGSSYPWWSVGDSTTRVYSPADRLEIKEYLPKLDMSLREGVPIATVFHAAVCLALSRQLNQKEVIVGRLVVGRSMLPGNLQNIVGPTMTEIPIRATVDDHTTLAELARLLQSQFIDDAAHETAGMEQIIRHSTTWPDKTRDFGWRTAFQQQEDGGFEFLGEPSAVAYYQRPMPPRSRPEVYATPMEDGTLEVLFEGNVAVVSEESVRGFLALLRREWAGY
ncbi:Uu.00g026220.m01.CDS01 [Anthostomella pinea]|uniref:Uu.00g026220.m01.CDS01 n=1 Tax=Anthostomella pinea TaxID=933095 RepID=A0AAI8YA63_9PEZI|nr:Uu.00g026220.m01.CDS01 [Anthostomella pinea]